MPSVMISSAQFSIGRHPNNDLHIMDIRLSGFHCRIERSVCPATGSMQVHLVDLSTNGTYKNGQLVSLGCSTYTFRVISNQVGRYTHTKTGLN